MDPILAAIALLKATGLGGWLTEKLGGLINEPAARKVIDVARAVTGIKDPAAMLEQLQADAALAGRLREKVMDNEQDIVRLSFADVANARAMQVAALQQGDEFAKRFVYWLAAVWTFAAILYIGLITFCRIPENNVRFADTILGFMLATVVATILQFFFGSAISNRSKDNSIAALIDATKPK